MWTCPECKAQFVTRNLWHSCVRMTSDEWLKSKPTRGVELYKHFLNEYRKIGPITLHTVKSRIAFMVQIRFSGVNKIKEDFIEGAFLLPENIDDERFFRVEFIPPIYFVHRFRLHDKSEIDDSFRKYMKMAYEMGERKHLKKQVKH